MADIRSSVRFDYGAADPRPRRAPARGVVWFAVVIALFGALFGLAISQAQVVRAEPPWPEPPIGTRTALPVLSYIGNDQTSQTLIQVQNVGSTFTRAIILYWAEAGACGPQALGPFKVECSGILKPGSTWMFGQGQVPVGAKSGIVYSFPQVQILNEDGDLVSVADEFCESLFAEVTFDADEFRRFDLAFRQQATFFDLPTAGGQPVAVDVVRVGPGLPSPDLQVSGAYAGVAGTELGAWDPVFGAFAYYAPMIYGNAAGLTSWVYIQNTGLSCSSVELWFQEQSDCLRAQVCEVAAVAPGETVQYAVSECVGPSFVGNVWIRTSQPSGVVIDHVGQDILMTDNGVAQHTLLGDSGSEVLFGPLIYREFQGWESAISVQNLSGTDYGAVKVYFYDESGNIITTLVDYICPRGTQTFFLPVINGLPGQYVGAVRVESLTPLRNAGGTSGGPNTSYVPIAAVAHLLKYADPVSSQAQEAISYNLFGENESFDWQMGPGNAAVIGVASVLKQQRGLSTELAIQNVNPFPGFTDFAMFIYDQNGLLEVVCEKLFNYNVEYINFASWGIFNPGFAGSIVISGVYTNQIPDGGDPNQNWFGLSAVAIQRVQNIIQFNAPGDESSGFEAFPILTDNFDVEGATPPLCPGLPLAACLVNVNARILINGEPLANAAVQLRRPSAQNVPVSTSTTDANGFVEFPDVPAEPGGTRHYQVWYFVEGGAPGTGQWVQAEEELVLTIASDVCVVSVGGLVIDVTPAGEPATTADIFVAVNCNQTQNPQVGIQVVLEDDTGTTVDTDVTSSAGLALFEDVAPGTYAAYVDFDGNGNRGLYEPQIGPIVVEAGDAALVFIDTCDAQ